MTEITDAEAAEVLWNMSEQARAAVRAAHRRAVEIGVKVDVAGVGAIVYAACLAAGWDGAGEGAGPEPAAASPFRDMESFVRWLEANGVNPGLPYGSRGIDPGRLMAGIGRLVAEGGEQQVRGEIAAAVEGLAENYPEDVFPPGSDVRDAISGTAMRHAYRNAARLIRENWGES